MSCKNFSKKFAGIIFPLIIVLFAYFVMPYIDIGKNAENEYPVNVYYIDVGQGDAALVDINGHYVMIDGGTDSSSGDTVEFIKSLGIRKFDCVIATHPHEDHIGGLDDIINAFGADKAYLSSGTTTTRTFENLLNALENTKTEIISAGAIFTVNDAKFEVFAPNSAEYSELNNYSLCIRMTYGNIKFMFTGDAEHISEKEMLSNGYDVDSDVLKVAHHGSETSSSEEFIAAVSPDISVVSVGRNNYGLPDKNIMDNLEACSEVFRTDINGTVTVSTDGKEMNISCDYN